MRRPVDSSRVKALIEALGRRASIEATIYLVDGATAVLHGWRETTRDIDMRIEPEVATGALGDEIVRLKQELEVSVELASPVDFLPELPGWRDRSAFIERSGSVTFRHFDFYGQALAKILRNVDHDPEDVADMLRADLVEPARAWQLFESIRPGFGRFPIIDEPSFRARMTAVFGPPPEESEGAV